MAEYLGRARLRSILGPNAQIASAGIRPQHRGDAANAVHTLRSTFGIDASGHIPQDVRSTDLQHFDLVVSIDDRHTNEIAQVVRTLGVTQERHVKWKIPDPYDGDFTEYEESALAICKALAELKRTQEAKTESQP